MGCHASKTDEELEAERENLRIERQLKREKRLMAKEIKLILLGTAESGKSTLLKQIQIIMNGVDYFPSSDLLDYKPILLHNTVFAMKTLLRATKLFSLDLEPHHQDAADRVLALDSSEISTFDKSLVRDLRRLWRDPAIQSSLQHSAEIQLIDSADYCFQNLKRIGAQDYVPTIDDIIYARAKTSGIIECNFEIGGALFRIFDVGGVRTERNKWVKCFDQVTAVIFCAALNEYDMQLAEDPTVNRMEESISLFREISNSKWFSKTSVILFFTKDDLFRQKVQVTNINCLFPFYTGGLNYDSAFNYIKDQYLHQNRNRRKSIFVHRTCTRDREQVRVIFNATREIIIRQNLERLGFGTF